MEPSHQNPVARRLLHNRKTIAVVSLLFAFIVAMIWLSISAKRTTEQKYISQFTASFNEETAVLCSTPEIVLNRPFPIPDIGPAKRIPRVTEYSITAKFRENGVEQWGRWFYTCNARHNDGFYRFSHSTAATPAALPTSPGLAHNYIPWATYLVDGIPTTAGATLTSLTIPSPVKATDQIQITATAPANSICRVEVFPSTAVTSIPEPTRPSPNGTVKWSLSLAPSAAGSRISVNVHCTEMRGTRLLDNTTQGLVDITP